MKKVKQGEVDEEEEEKEEEEELERTPQKTTCVAFVSVDNPYIQING